MTGNVGRSLLEGAQAGQAMMATPLDVMHLRQERYLRQQELDRQKAQLAMQMAYEYGRGAQDFPKTLQMLNQATGQQQSQPQQNPLQNPVIQQRIQQQQAQAIGQAANNIEVKGDSDGLSFKGSAADVAMAAQHPVLGKIIRDAAAKNMQSSLPATSTQLAQPLTNPQSSKFQSFAKQPQESAQEAPQATPTPISPPTAAPMPPTQETGQGEAIPEPDLSAVEKPDVTLPQGTTMSMPKTYKDFSQIPSNIFAASKEGVPSEQAGLTPTLLDFVKKQEGFSPKAYADGAQTSVGYGTRATSPDEKISEPEATQRLSNELLQSREAVMTAAQQKGLQLAPNQLDALTSFDYNTGAGSRIISQAKSVQDIPQLMAQFTRAGNEHPQGLINRRMAEIEMFNGGMNTAQAGLGGAPDFNLGQNVAKAQQELNQQNPFSKPDYTKMIPAGQEDNTLLQKSLALGIPYVEKTNVDTTPQDLRNQGIFGKNTELNQLAYAPKTHSITKWNDELPERQQKVNNLNKLLSELDEFQTINAREGTSPVKNILMEMSHNVTSSDDYQRLANLALNFYGATDKSGTQVRNFAEFTAFMKSMPNISNNPEANAKIIERIRAMTNRDLDRNDSEANYFSAHQTLDGFNQNWDKFNRDVPVMKGDKVNPNYRDYQGYFAKDALRKLGVNVPEENQQTENFDHSRIQRGQVYRAPDGTMRRKR